MNNSMLLIILSNRMFSLHPLLLQLRQIFLILKHCIAIFVSNRSRIPRSRSRGQKHSQKANSSKLRFEVSGHKNQISAASTKIQQQYTSKYFHPMAWVPIGLTLVPKNCAALPQNWKMAMPRAR